MSSLQRVRPAKRLVQAGGKCAQEGAAYGQCILQSYQTMTHHKCDKEFVKFRQCVLEVMKRN